MSYSFSVQATTKAEASKKVAEELAKVVLSQPVHAGDQKQAQAAADGFIALLRDDTTQDVSVNVNGSVWSADGGLNQAAVSVSAQLVKKGS